MKPFQIIVLVAFAIFALIGIFLFATYSGLGGGTSQAGSVVIWGTLPDDGIEAGLEALAVTNKEFSEVTYVEVAPSVFDVELAEALASGSGPDLLIITQEQILSQQAKLSLFPYASVSERTYVSSFLPLNELFLTSEGAFGMPLAVDPLVLYYNRAHLATAGVANPPSTWEAVTALAERLSQKRADQTITRSAIALGEYDNVTNARAIVSVLLLQAGTPITSRTEQGVDVVLHEAGEERTASALAFYTQFANPVKTVYSWNRSLPSSQATFLAGDVSFYIGYASERQYLAAANPNLDFDIAPLPQPATVSGKTTYGLAYAFAIPRASKNPGGALRAAIALTTTGPMKASVEVLGMAPARRALLSTPPDRYAEVYYPEALSARGWLSPSPTDTDTVFSAMISNITTGRRDLDEALRIADQSLTAEL